MTYWDNPLSHIRTEFGFDVLQVAQGRYATDQYRKFIGFQVGKNRYWSGHSRIPMASK